MSQKTTEQWQRRTKQQKSAQNQSTPHQKSSEVLPDQMTTLGKMPDCSFEIRRFNMLLLTHPCAGRSHRITHPFPGRVK